jgi:hypothetical protein
MCDVMSCELVEERRLICDVMTCELVGKKVVFLTWICEW